MASIDVEKLKELWRSDLRNADIAAALGISEMALYSASRRLRLPNRCLLREIRESPTPAQIRARAAEVRRRWSEEEREKRVVGRRRQRWTPPEFARGSYGKLVGLG